MVAVKFHVEALTPKAIFSTSATKIVIKHPNLSEMTKT